MYCSLSILVSLSNLYSAVSFRFASVKRVSRASVSSPHTDLLSYIRASLDKLEGTHSCILILSSSFETSRSVVNKVLEM